MSSNAKSTDANKKTVRRLTIPKLMAHKGGEPMVCLTAYTAPMAGLLDPHCEILLVGDSLGMVLYGMDTTLPVTLDMMIAHGRAVVKASQHAVVIIDMPFGSYEESPEMAFRNCARALAETGAQGIKLEGGREMAPTIRFLTRRGIPVMAHVGLTPQSVNTLGGFITQGKAEADRERLIEDAKAVAEAGAFSTVLEAVTEPLGKAITDAVPNLTIGIGASAACDGQILVTEDMLGLFSWNAKFVKRYAELRNVIDKAVADYAAEVRARSFPAAEHTYKVKTK